MITMKAVMDSLLEHAAGAESLAMLSQFRLDFHACRPSAAMSWPCGAVRGRAGEVPGRPVAGS